MYRGLFLVCINFTTHGMSRPVTPHDVSSDVMVVVNRSCDGNDSDHYYHQNMNNIRDTCPHPASKIKTEHLKIVF